MKLLMELFLKNSSTGEVELCQTGPKLLGRSRACAPSWYVERVGTVTFTVDTRYLSQLNWYKSRIKFVASFGWS
jgi:hypothetical protein